MTTHFKQKPQVLEGNSKETYHFEDRKWLKMSISCLSLAIKAKLFIFHTANNKVIPSVSKKTEACYLLEKRDFQVHDDIFCTVSWYEIAFTDH